jgi:hypothetical protein
MANYTNNTKAQELWKTLYLCASIAPDKKELAKKVRKI